MGWSGKIIDASKNLVTNKKRALKAYYAAAELLWYLSGSKEIDMIKRYAPQYERFAEDGIAHGAYGHRWRHNPGWNEKSAGTGMSQLVAVAKFLKENRRTRQAVVTMWDSGDLMHAIKGDRKDLPCTVSLQFLRRNRKLHAVCYMRSNDAWLGLPYDVYCFTSVQKLVADFLGVKVGTYSHCVGSMHLYERDLDKAAKVLFEYEYNHQGSGSPDLFNVENSMHDKDANLTSAISRSTSVEKIVRTVGDLSIVDDLPQKTLLTDCVRACARKVLIDAGEHVKASQVMGGMSTGALRTLSSRDFMKKG